MVAVQDFLSAGTTIVILSIVVAAAAKLFQIASDVREAKAILTDIRRNTGGAIAPNITVSTPVPGSSVAAAPSKAPSAEDLVRAVHAQSFKDDDFPL